MSKIDPNKLLISSDFYSVQGEGISTGIPLGIPYIKVPAKEWQKEMFKGVDEITKPGKTSRDTKAMALVAIKRLFPELKLTFNDRSTKPHDGLIDAVLIAEYSKRKNL